MKLPGQQFVWKYHPEWILLIHCTEPVNISFDICTAVCLCSLPFHWGHSLILHDDRFILRTSQVNWVKWNHVFKKYIFMPSTHINSKLTASFFGIIWCKATNSHKHLTKINTHMVIKRGLTRQWQSCYMTKVIHLVVYTQAITWMNICSACDATRIRMATVNAHGLWIQNYHSDSEMQQCSFSAATKA